MLKNYISYLEHITVKINSFFENQQEYICCRKGCAKCCKSGTYPYTKIEYDLIKHGFNLLNPEIKFLVTENIKNVLNDKKNQNPKEKFLYRCPFLVNETCSVYSFRGIICRIFGLMSFQPDTDKTPKIPFCAYEGLNYSRVLDKDTNLLVGENFKELGYSVEPKAFNIDYKTLINEDFGEGFGFKFGEVKPLIDRLGELVK